MIWRCRVCEGVNQGGRTCATCGAQVPVTEPLRAAARTRIPKPAPVPPSMAPVPPTTGRRELRDMPTPEDLSRMDPFDLLSGRGDFKVIPIPGGCLFAGVPRGLRPRG
jgi:hypothetical protein